MNDEAYCRRVVRIHARTFWLASRFLPSAKRRAAFALYAFCRVADDVVDVDGRHETDVATRLAGYRRQLDNALGGRPEGPVFRELARAAHCYGVPAAVLYELLDGVARDCAPAAYETWEDLTGYCEGVASSVGEMCAHVFGVPGGTAARARATEKARTLGVAMQLTNVLRDVGEDALKGRCYLPEADLARFGLSRAEVLSGRIAADERWRSLMAFEIQRARALYDEAMPGIALLAPDSRRCAAACAVGYAGILGAIEAIEYDTFRARARLGTLARASVLWSVWRTPIGNVDSGQASGHDEEIASWA
ncbi:MAG: phytoene/squalene synthase family protein [bacterium]